MNEVRTQAPTLKDFLTKHIDAIQQVSAATITPDKMVRLVCAASLRQPDLAICTPLSILNSMMQAATYGLGVCDGSNEAYLVPYNVKVKGSDGRERWEKQAQFMPGYQGLVKKAIESNKVRNIESRVVYEHDTFDYELGLKPNITHKPKLGKDRGDVIAFYAVAFLPDGSTQFEVMSIDEVLAIKARSKSGNSGPWVSDFNEMGRKTVVRRLYKYIPKSKDMAALLEIQAKAEAGEFISGEVIRPGDAPSLEMTQKIIDGDGNSVYDWTQEDREEAKANLDSYCESMLSAGIDADECQSFADDHSSKIGDPELNPATWSNRAFNASERAIQAHKKN